LAQQVGIAIQCRGHVAHAPGGENRHRTIRSSQLLEQQLHALLKLGGCSSAGSSAI